MAKLTKIGAIPVIAVVITIILMVLFKATGPVYNPKYLLLILNTIFIAGTGIIVTVISARSYLKDGSINILLLGSATLIAALVALIAGWLSILSSNQNVTIYDSGFMVSSALQLSSALSLLYWNKLRTSGRKSILAMTYGAVLIFVGLYATMSARDVFPKFFTNSGATWVDQSVLGISITFFALSFLIYIRKFAKLKSEVLYWYSLALVLFAVGLFGVALQPQFSDSLSWMGRIAQYIGGVYFMIALLRLKTGSDEDVSLPTKWAEAFRSDRVQVEALFSNMLDGFAYRRIIVDESGKPVDYVTLAVNDAYENMIGQKRESLVGKRGSQLISGGDADLARQIETFGRVALTGESVQFEDYSTALKRWYHISVYSPKKDYFATILEDITERKNAEEALAIAKNQLAQELAGSLRLQELSMIFVSQDNIQALLDKIVLAAIEIMHADMGNMQRITKEGELRIVAQNGFKQPFLDFFNCVGTDSHAACGFAMASKKRVIIEDVTQSPIFLNTPALDVQLEAGVRAVVSTPFFTRSGEFLGVISTHYRTARQPNEFDLRLLDLLVRQAADFVERTQNEQKLEDYSKNLEKLVEERTKQLKDSERLATIGATAGMVGHDIRNPLQAITGDVYLAKTELASIPESEEKKSALESLQEIEKNTDYINKIVQDLQDFARPLKPNIEEVDLKIIIEDLLKKNGLPENVKVSVKVESDARKIVADSTFVNRVMYNLVNNAVQAMPKGGKLTIHSYKEANDILITVKDTGVGIPEAVKGKLFTPMFTTKAKGQGFGLPVIKRMTEALGGTVTFESQEGKGTTFIIRLHKELKGK